ncbi:Voltage-dependent calcium channel subunit alpha-2/delta-3 [Nymphon striatum]|nr:Voltage-dependent calcium channel subunit alpha-2/delta-3 [Nymphon striatum]
MQDRGLHASYELSFLLAKNAHFKNIGRKKWYKEDIFCHYDYKNSKRSVPFASFTGEEKGYIVEQSDIPDGHYSHSDKKLKHFENIEVSLNHSTVYVPPNVNDQEDKILNSIKWSEKLDALFMSNHDADPTLTWQYFASSTGFIRQYPGTTWHDDDKKAFDSRMRSWYLEAAASTKDVVILLDSSSMAGANKGHIKNILSTLLDTLTINDFFSAIVFTDSAKHVLPCSRNNMMQATVDNIKLFKMHIETIEFEDIIGDVRVGLKKALKTLSKSRENGFSSGCNQAIISVTDRSYSSYKTMFETYVWPNNNTVNTFTYSFRRDGSNGRKGSWKSCGKFGYFSYISKTSDIKEQVLNYINVIANPQFSQPHKPVVWTNVYADLINIVDKFECYVIECQCQVSIFGQKSPFASTYSYSPDFLRRLMASVSVPVRMKDKEKGTLIGVAGTDVPINEIKKLLTPYKLGVNGYSFAITNNGDVLFHPDHRPLYHDLVKPSFNNVDLTEVESVIKDDQYFGPEKLEKSKVYLYFLNLRWSNKKIRTQFLFSFCNHFRWVASHQKRYYYGPINETPFSLGLVLPIGYGHNKIVGKVKVTQASARNYIGYLRGNWSLHPDCPLRFLMAKQSEHIRMTFGITSSFVGTRSGFTRYEMYEDHNDSDWHSNPRMDRIPRRTIDELYYKQAVDFHFYNASAFVYTIPTDAARRDRNEIRVTGSYAIFPEVNGLTSPWGVVGVNMKHAMLASRFFNITSEQRPKCPMNCSSDDYLCYLLDNNGYVVVSSNHADTGKLFEEIDVNLMKALLEFEIYKNWLFEMSTYGWFTETFSLDNNFDPLDVPESTRPRRCYKEIKLYHYKEVPSYRPVTGRMSQCHSSKCGRSFVVTSVPKSNLLLLVVNVECPCVPYTIRHEQKEVQNDAIKANCPEKKRKLYRRPLKEKCVQSYPHVCI